MKIETIINQNHQAELTVELASEVLERAKKRAARRISKKIKISGFRPGKAPYNIIQKQIGEDVIIEEALELVLDEVYPDILEEADIDPYGPGSLKNVPTLDPPTLEITIPLAPKVELGDYKAIRIKFVPKIVTDEDVQKVVENLRDRQAIIEPVEREAQEGDIVSVILSAERKGEDADSKKLLIEERTVPIIIEKEETDSSDEWPYPGYSRTLIDNSVKQKISTTYTFSDDYTQEELRGIEAVFQTEISEIKGRSLPELDDAFAISAGDYKSYEHLLEEVNKSIEERNDQEQNAEYENSIIDAMLEEATFKYPPQMIDHEIEHHVEDLIRNLKSQGLDMDVYLKSRSMDLEKLKEDFRPAAEDRIRRGLILVEVAKTEKIEVKSKEVQDKVKKMINDIKEIFSEAEGKKLLNPEYIERLTQNMISEEVTIRTLEKLQRIAKGEAEKNDVVSKDKKEAKETAADESSR